MMTRTNFTLGGGNALANGGIGYHHYPIEDFGFWYGTIAYLRMWTGVALPADAIQTLYQNRETVNPDIYQPVDNL